MAKSRLEKVGSIYSRTKGLLDTGALAWVDRPLWYDVYEAFPPKDEPRFDRVAPKINLRKIFYEEDRIRAAFHQNNKYVGTINLSSTKGKTITQQFIDVYRKVDEQYEGKADRKKVYLEAVEMLKAEKEKGRKDEDEYLKLSTAFKEVKENKDAKIDFKNLFGDK